MDYPTKTRSSSTTDTASHRRSVSDRLNSLSESTRRLEQVARRDRDTETTATQRSSKRDQK